MSQLSDFFGSIPGVDQSAIALDAAAIALGIDRNNLTYWIEGEKIDSPKKVRVYNKNAYYAPTASASNVITCGESPLTDPEIWKQYNVNANVQETVILGEGELEVQFNEVNCYEASFFIDGDFVDSGRLSSNEYVVQDEKTIILQESYPSGTTLMGLSNFNESPGININPISETVTLSESQIEVTFSTILTSPTSFYLCGDLVDSGRLCPVVDYILLSSTSIELTNSYPDGTKIIGIYNDTGDISPVDYNFVEVTAKNTSITKNLSEWASEILSNTDMAANLTGFKLEGFWKPNIQIPADSNKESKIWLLQSQNSFFVPVDDKSFRTASTWEDDKINWKIINYDTLFQYKSGKSISLTDDKFNPPQKIPSYDESIDWSVCINSADEWCRTNGYTLFWPDGIYCIKSNILWGSKWKTTSPAAEVAPFPQLDDDKRFLRPNQKNNLPGVVIMAMSGNYETITTQRSDMFETLTPVVKTIEKYSVSLKGGLSIIQDMDVLDEQGNLTLPNTDNRSSGFDVGLLVDDSSACDFDNLSIFGYFNKSGLSLWSHGVGDNPDYCKFGKGSTSGYYGLSIIANDTTDGPGLSGTQFCMFQIFANDHHSRKPQGKTSFQNNSYGHCLFIDGKTPALNADVNGHLFSMGGFRTYSNSPIILNNASNVHLNMVPFEFSVVSGESDTGSQKFYATENTRNVSIMQSRNCSPTLWNHSNFGSVIEELNVTSDNFGGTWWGNKGKYIGIIANSNTNHPKIRFTNNPGSSVEGFNLSTDNNIFSLELGSTEILSFNSNGKNISNKIVSTTLSNETLDISAIGNTFQVSSSGDISSIVPLITGTTITLMALANNTNTLKVSGGNIRSKDSNDVVLNGNFALVDLYCNGNNWIIK